MTIDNYIEKLHEIVESHRTQYGKFLRRPENKELLDFINDYEQDKLNSNNLQTKIYWILNGLHDYPICHNPECHNKVTSNVRNIFIGYGTEYPTCCSSCAKKTPEYLKNYGDSLKSKYGSRHPMHCQEIKEKVKKTTIEKWGGIGFASKEIHDMYENTYMDRFGVPNGGGSDQALKKIIETKLKKYNQPYFIFPNGEHGMVSKGEKEVLEYVRSIYNGTIVENDRTQMTPDNENQWIENHELDIWIPDIRCAIEFNGTYWHNLPNIVESDKFKKLQCEAKNIHLLSIDEKDWDLDKNKCFDIVNTFIRQHL